MPSQEPNPTSSPSRKGFYPSRKFINQELVAEEDATLLLITLLITRFVESNWTIQEVNELCEIIALEHNRACLQIFANFENDGFGTLHKTFAKAKGIDAQDQGA